MGEGRKEDAKECSLGIEQRENRQVQPRAKGCCRFARQQPVELSHNPAPFFATLVVHELDKMSRVHKNWSRAHFTLSLAFLGRPTLLRGRQGGATMGGTETNDGAPRGKLFYIYLMGHYHFNLLPTKCVKCGY